MPSLILNKLIICVKNSSTVQLFLTKTGIDRAKSYSILDIYNFSSILTYLESRAFTSKSSICRQLNMVANILIIEDELRIAAFISKGLKKAGYQTQTALDGTQALPLALSGDFDLILLDLGLPGLDGISILHEFRSQALQTPVIVMTALDSKEQRQQVLALGGNEFIAKPFRFKHILNAIHTHLSSQKVDEL